MNTSLVYENIKVEGMQLISYLGNQFKNHGYYINQRYFQIATADKLTFPFTFECPYEDMIYIYHQGVSGFASKDRETLLKGLNELKKIFPKTYVNFSLDGFLPQGNNVDITGDEFKKLFC